MRKNLLLIAVLVLTITAYGQKIWNMGGDANVPNPFATSSGIGTGPFPVYIDGLAITGIDGNVNMGAVNASAKTFETYSFLNRFQFNGAGYSGAAAGDAAPSVNMPTQRYVSFNVNGDATVYMIGVTGSSGSERRMFVTDGTSLIGSVVFPASSNLSDGTVNYKGPAATLYVFGNSAINLALLSTTNYVAASVNQIDVNKTIISEKFYNVLGHEIQSNSKGLVIRKVTYQDGTTSTLKNYVNWVK